MFCSKCGNQVSESALFCNECGAQVKTSAYLKVESQSTQTDTKQKKDQKTKKQIFERQRKVSANVFAIASLLSLVASIVIYIFVWVSIFNQPYTTVSGWSLVIIYGVFSVLRLMMLSAAIVNSANLAHKKIIIAICAISVLNDLYGIGISVLSIIDSVQFWVRAQTSDNVFIGDGFEITILKNCLGIVFSVAVIVACILTVYTAKKQKEGLAKILLVFFAISIIYVLVPLFGKEMRMMRWQNADTYFRMISVKLQYVSMCLFWGWFLVKSRQQARRLL